MSGIPLAKSEFKQIQTDLLTELTADLSVDHLDLDLGSSADDGTVLGDTKNKTIQIHLGVSARNPMIIGERKGA